MAERYWIGGTGDWSDNTNHWSTSSGGSGGAVLPTSSDNVHVDSSSGFGSGGTITVDMDAVMNDIICNSGYTFTISEPTGNWGFVISGSVTFESGLTLSLINAAYLNSTGTETFTAGGATIDSDLSFAGVGSTYTLQDNLVISGKFYLDNGTFDANDHNVTVANFDFYADVDYAPVITMGSGTWKSTGDDIDHSFCWYNWEFTDHLLTITPETSTLEFSNTSSNNKTMVNYVDEIVSSGKTFNNLKFSGKGTLKIYNSNTYNNFRVDNPASTVKFADGTTQTVSSWTVTGTSGNLITLNSIGGTINTYTITTAGSDYLENDIIYLLPTPEVDSGMFTVTSVDGSGGITGLTKTDSGSDFVASTLYDVVAGSGVGAQITVNTVSVSQHNLSKASGTLISDYLDLSNSNATGGATWYAGSHSNDTTNNDGWIFTAPPVTLRTLASLGVGK